MKYKEIEVVQLPNNNILLKLKDGGRVIVGHKGFANDETLKKVADAYLNKNS